MLTKKGERERERESAHQTVILVEFIQTNPHRIKN